MAKKFESTERFLKPDPRYQSMLLAKFINCVMKQGKKTAARKICYDAFDVIAQKLPDQKPDEVFTQAVNNVKPMVEVSPSASAARRTRSRWRSRRTASRRWRSAGFSKWPATRAGSP